MQLTPSQARRYLLAHQGLYPPRSESGIDGLQRTVDRLRCIQFDPIDVVGRNHEIVLHGRVRGFRRRQLEKVLYEDRTLIEGWDKQMSFGPAEDWPSFAPFRKSMESHHRFLESGPLKEILPRIREEIQTRAPLSSLEIDSDERMDWSWAPARSVRAALEALWFRGELGIHHREGTRRYYDDFYRLFPHFKGVSNKPHRSERAWWEWRVLRRIGSVGFLPARRSDGWLGMEDLKTAERVDVIKSLVDQAYLEDITIPGLPYPVYRRCEDHQALATALQSPSGSPKAVVLAPLDNLLWDRQLIRDLFGFHYLWEVYKPQEKRQWGYYVLPLLYGERFIGRLEARRDKEASELVVERWWPEDRIHPSAAMAKAVDVAMKALTRSAGLSSYRCKANLGPLFENGKT